MIDVSVLIVNYNTADLVHACIESVLMQKGVSFEIIVVDNASSDRSVSLLKDLEGEGKIQLIANQDNKGFGSANNQAAKLAQGKYFYLLNPDAVCLGQDVLKGMYDYMEANSKVGLSGTQVMKTRKGGYSVPQYDYPSQRYTNVSFSHLPGKIAWVIGASMFIRREVFALVNGFDESYFLYGEEADLCLRIRKANYEIAYHPLVAVSHVSGATEEKQGTREVWRRKQNGLQLFIKKHYPESEARKVMKQYYKRARRKLLILHLRRLLGLLNQEREAMLIRYQTVLEQSKAYLLEGER